MSREVKLSAEDQKYLHGLLKKGRDSARKLELLPLTGGKKIGRFKESIKFD
jgi:hypothetical protein